MSVFYNNKMMMYNIIVSEKWKADNKENAYELGTMDRLL